MKKFEYNVVKLPMKGFFTKDVDPKLLDSLNRQGKNGWELVNSFMPMILGETEKIVLIFKREL